MNKTKKIKTKRRIIIVLLSLFILLIAYSIGGSFFMLDYALRPPKVNTQVAEQYKVVCKTYPFLQPWVDSLNRAHALRDTFILNNAGKRLQAYYISAARPTKKTAVLVHGYRSHAIAMMMIAYMYHAELQYNVLLPNLQYHGNSDGCAIQMGWLDRFDVMQWMRVANHIFGDSTQMVVHGISMGGATTMMVAGEQQPDFVKCFVEDCGYTSVWDEFSNELNKSFHLPSFPLMNIANWLCKIKYGWSFKEASSINQLKTSMLPMLFIHGDNDTYVPTWMVYPLYEAKPEPKQLWLVPNASHAVAYKENIDEYTQRVKDFTSKYIY